MPEERMKADRRDFYLGMVEAATGREIDLGRLKLDLRAAQLAGLDPKELYEEATEDRPEEWPPAPAWETVAP